MFRIINSLNSIFSIIILIFFTIVFTEFFYNKKQESKIYNTKNYSLTFQDLNKDFDKETFLFPYHLKLMNIRLEFSEFINYCKFLSISFTLIFLWISLNKIQLSGGLFIASAIVLSPVYLIHLNWVGFPEHMMFMILGLLVLLILYKDNIPYIIFNSLMFTLCIIGFWMHFYQFLVSAFFILSVDFRFRRHIPFSILFNFIISLIVSKLLVNIIFNINGVIQDYDRFEYAFSKSMFFWYETHKHQFPLSILSLFNGLIFLILYLIIFQRDRILIGIFVLSVCVTFFTFDTTRVFTNIFYPAFFYYLILHIEEIGHKSFKIYFALIIMGFLYLGFSDQFYIWGSRLIYLK